MSKLAEYCRALGYSYRLDWSEVDGRTIKSELDQIANLIEKQETGEDIDEQVDFLLEDVNELIEARSW